MRRLATVLAALALVAGTAGTASAQPQVHWKQYHFRPGCDSLNHQFELHESGHLADLTEVITRCWTKDGYLKKSGTGVTWKFHNTPAGKVLGMSWDCTHNVTLDTKNLKDIECIGHDQACLFEIVPICGFNEYWHFYVTVQGPEFNTRTAADVTDRYTGTGIQHDNEHSSLSAKPNNHEFKNQETVKHK